MKIILLQDEKKLGKKGQIIEASEGYARNYLIPRNLAKPADNKSLSEANSKKAAIKFKQDTDRELAQKQKEAMNFLH